MTVLKAVKLPLVSQPAIMGRVTVPNNQENKSDRGKKSVINDTLLGSELINTNVGMDCGD